MKERSDLKALVVIAAATALLFWPVWIAGYRFPRGGGDLWGQLYPVWSYVSRWLRRGSFPLWSTQMMAGDPIIAEAQYGLLNPLNWPMFLFSPIPAWIVSTRAIVSLWLAGAGLYLYLRRAPVWRLSQPAALLGAIAYLGSDPFISHLGHPQFNDTMAWVPWILLGLEYAARTRRAIPLTGLALGLLLLAGHGQAALYALVLIAAYGLWLVTRGGFQHQFFKKPAESPSSGTALTRLRRFISLIKWGNAEVFKLTEHIFHRAGRLVLVGVLAVGVAAPGLLPTLERLPHTDRAAVPPDGGEYEFQLGMWIDFITPWFHGRGVKGFWGPWDRVETGYIGVVALALATLGIVSNWKQPRTWALLITGFAATLFAMGHQGPLYPLVDNLPLFNATWKTGRAIYIVSLVLALGAALGLETLRHKCNVHIWVIGIAVSSLLLWTRSTNLAGEAPQGSPYIQAVAGLRLAAVMLFATSALGLAAIHSQLWTPIALGLLLLTELTATSAFADVEPPPIQSDPHVAAIDYLRADPGWFRVDVDGKARGLWSPAAVMAAGFEVPQGTGNPMELVAYTQFYWAVPYKGAPAYQILGAKYIITPKDALPGGDGIWPVFTQDLLIDIHLNTNALTRVWLIYNTLPVTTLEEAYSLIFSSDFKPTRTATIRDGPKLNGDGQGTLQVLAYSPNRVAIEVDTDQTALLVLSDLQYPGWQAFVDQNPATLYTTNGLFRGVIIPPGEHHVEMRFFPLSLRLGLALFSAAVLMVGIIGARQIRDHLKEEHEDE